MRKLSTFCLIIFFLLSSFHPFPCDSSHQELGLCDTLFQCGNITAGIPFWGRNRSKHCGHPLLELHCNKNNSTSLIISDQEYYVLHIDHTPRTLTLVRADMLGPFCSSKFNTTTFPPDILEISPTYKSLHVFYCCCPSIHHLSSYTCPDKSLISVSENPEYRQTCLGNFTVNVPVSFNITKEKKLNMTNLENVLRKGFEVKVKIDKIASQNCSSSHGRYSSNGTILLGAKCDRSHPPTGKCLSTKAKAGIEAASFATMGIILAVVCLFCFISRRRKTSDDPRTKSSDDLSRTTSDNPRQQYLKALIPLKHYSYEQVERITKSFAEVVGKGGFGTVYRGTLCDGRSVAVKILKDSHGDGEDFINEVATMSKTSHVNIVTLLGFCSENSKRAIIYEFMENGSLDKFVSGKRSSYMNWRELYGIALGVARGLEYLHHGCRTRIVHFDIKPQNVLLDENLLPKVSDFGLAKLCERKESILSLLDTRGTIGYIAPEVFSRVYGKVSHKSDVYSYGMLVLEMIGARNKTSTEDIASSTSSTYFPEWIYDDLDKEDNGRLMKSGIKSEEDEIAKKMTLVGLWCIQSCPSDRPAMNRVVEMMEGNLDALEVPPKPVLQNPSMPVLDDISAYTEVCSINFP